MRQTAMIATILALTTLTATLAACDDPVVTNPPDQNAGQTAKPEQVPAGDCQRAADHPCS